MNEKKPTGINPEDIREYMTRALAIDEELIYRFESAGMIEEIRLLYEHARCCLRTLAQVQNDIELEQYKAGRLRQIEFNISDTVDDLVSVARSRMRQTGIRVECEIERGVRCIADPDRFSICLMNLIVNALQNVDRDEGEVKVSVKKRFDVASVSVIDNGYGMTQQELSESTNREDGPCGFEILRKFCESVGTSPIFETIKNGGLMVTVKVPLAPPNDKLEMNSDVIPTRIGAISPSSVLLYKLEETMVIL